MTTTRTSDAARTALFLMGLSGAGKTALADRLAADDGWVTFHGGRRLVDMARSRNDQALLGDLRLRRPVAAPLFLDLVEQAAPSLRNHDVVFDGFPRNLEHLSIVDRICQATRTSAGPRNAVFVHLVVPPATARTRRSQRFECPSCGTVGREGSICESCNVEAALRVDENYPAQDEERALDKLISVLESRSAHLWELDASDAIETTLALLKRLLGLPLGGAATGLSNDLRSLVLPPVATYVAREVSLFVDSLRLANVRRFFHQRFFEDETRDAEYADRVESTPKLENVASHSWHVADGVLLFGPRLPGINCERATQLAVLHDKMEMFIGDKDPIGRDGTGRKAHAFNEESKRRKRELEELAIDRYVARLPETARKVQHALLDEALLCQSPEARLVKSVDKLAALAFILVKKAGRSTEKHVELLHALTLRNMTFYPPMAEHHREVLRRIVKSVAKARNLSVEDLCDTVGSSQQQLF